MNRNELNDAISKLTAASAFRGGNKSPVVGRGIAAAINLRSEQGAYYTADAVARAEAYIVAALAAV